jgi:hypothetical protein
VQDYAVYLGVDSTSRSSVRLESKTMWRHGLFVYDVAHLPARRCGVWPAMWTYGRKWPTNGEIDVYEGWNDNYPQNRQTLHTGPGCTVRGTGMTGRLRNGTCDSTPGNTTNEGCSADSFDGSFGNPDGGICELPFPPRVPHILQDQLAELR